MLSNEEIIQFHQHGRITRQGMLMGKIPFVVRTFTVGDNLAFTRTLKDIKPTDSEEYIANFISHQTLRRCLVSFNNAAVTDEQIANFLPTKCNIILDEWRKLCRDLEDYLKGFSEKELDPEEVEQFILTDQITRGETLHGPDEAPPIQVRYRILNISDHTDVHGSVRELMNEGTPRLLFEAELQKKYAARMIESINGAPVDEESILRYNAELIAFVLNRALSIEQQMVKLLSNPAEMGEAIKKS